MRLFFLMLFLLNGAFFAVNALREPQTTNITHTFDSTIPPLVLLVEKNNGDDFELKDNGKEQDVNKPQEPSLDLKTWLNQFTAETAIETHSPQDIPNSQATPSQEIEAQCYTAGPFQTQESLALASDFFNDANIQFQQRSIVENHYIGMLVYIPSLPNRKSVVAMAETLAAKGVKDYMLLNEPGKKHSLSLGVYGLKKNATQRIKALSQLNYDAKSEARYRKKTIYWLDYELNDTDEQTTLSAQQMKSLNVSQIQRNCKS